MLKIKVERKNNLFIIIIIIAILTLTLIEMIYSTLEAVG